MRPGMVGPALYPPAATPKTANLEPQKWHVEASEPDCPGLGCRGKVSHFNELAALPALTITVVLKEPHPTHFDHVLSTSGRDPGSLRA